MHYSFKTAKQKKDKELKDKIKQINSAIDDLIIKGRTDTKHYQSLIRIHSIFLREYEM